MSRDSTKAGKKFVIIKAGLELFAAKGYRAVSVRDIARAVGVFQRQHYINILPARKIWRYEIVKNIWISCCLSKPLILPAVEKLCKIVEITYDWYQYCSSEIKIALLSQYDY